MRHNTSPELVRILLVDDEEGIRVTLAALLRKNGFDVTAVATLADALTQINSARYDVLLCDLNIENPGDGFVVTSAMRYAQPHCVGAVLTGYPSLENALEALQQQIDEFFTKPTDVNLLIKRIKEKLETRRLNQAMQSKNLPMLLLPIFQCTGEGLYVIDVEGRVLLINPRACEILAYRSDELVGKRIHDIAHYKHPDGSQFFESECPALAVITRGERVEIDKDHFVRKDGSFVPVSYTSSPIIREGGGVGAVVVFRDISARLEQEKALRKAEERIRTIRELNYAALEKQVKERTAELEQRNQALRDLSMRLMHSQDEERRRISRELHDSAGQYLGALSMILEAIRGGSESKNLPPSIICKLNEASEVTTKCTSEIRTISHLLHPPLLQELGLASAARWYVEGFAARSGIHVEVEIPEELGRLKNDVELAMFRVLQEFLTNIHRHSGSKTATVRIAADSEKAWLEVEDHGKGRVDGVADGDSSMPFRSGVGITGMRERVRDLGGRFEITSGPSGTRVKVVVPLRAVQRATKNTLASSSARPLIGAAALPKRGRRQPPISS